MMRYSSNGKKFEDIAKEIRKAMRTTLPREIRIVATDWFDSSFKNQGFTDRGFQPWTPRKGERLRIRLGGARKMSRKDKARRAILIGSGRLRRSIKGKAEPGRVIFESHDVPYAAIHNTGGYAGRGLKARIPRRKFMGESAMLNQEIKHIIDKAIKTAYRK